MMSDNNFKSKKSVIKRLDPALSKPSYGNYMHIQRYKFAAKNVYGKVLDLGCGFGYGSAILANSEKVEKVIGADISTSAVEYAKKIIATTK